MTATRDKLRAMKACAPALRWIGDRTIEQAWRECGRSDWMCWLLERIAPGDPRLLLAAADMAERVWGLIPDEPTRLAAAWAIGAARRGDTDEMDAASHATVAATVAAAAAYAADAAARSFASRTAESAAQADILRWYFSAREVGELFRRATA